MKFSIIIPTFNRPAQLQRCLTALARLSYPKGDYEVLIVDDGGSSCLQEIVAIVQPSMNARLIRQSNGGPASARNTGAARAIGQLLAFTDDDCEPDSEWLAGLDVALSANPDALIGGRTLNGLTRNPFATSSQLISDFCHSYFNTSAGGMTFFQSNNMALAKNLYDRMGGFNEVFSLTAGEDRDFCDRWLAAGRKFAFAPGALIIHRHEMGLYGFWRQHFHYGRGGWTYALSRRRRNRGGVRFEGTNFHLNLVLSPFRAVPPKSAPLLSALLAVSQIALASGYAYERFFANSAPRQGTANQTAGSFREEDYAALQRNRLECQSPRPRPEHADS